MKDLIARLEKATGPDRELDCAILIATVPGWVVSDRLMRKGRPIGPWVGWHAETKEAIGVEQVPAYTASLDAAMTLVPESYQWSVTDWRMEAFAQIGATISTATAKTPAVALCIASLKSRSLPDTEGKK